MKSLRMSRFVAAEGSLSPLHIAEPCWRGQCRAMDGNPATLAFAALTFLLGGLVKGVIGVGLPTVAIGLLSLVIMPAQAAALLIAPTLATNVWQAAMGPGAVPLLRRL